MALLWYRCIGRCCVEKRPRDGHIHVARCTDTDHTRSDRKHALDGVIVPHVTHDVFLGRFILAPVTAPEIQISMKPLVLTVLR